MKLFDKVKVLVSREQYKERKIYEGMIGTIIDAEIRERTFNVIFTDPTPFTEETMYSIKPDIICAIHIKDLKIVEESNCTDEYLLENLPKQNPKWFCKVENGYIVNFLGEKLNKIPYDYDS